MLFAGLCELLDFFRTERAPPLGAPVVTQCAHPILSKVIEAREDLNTS